MRSSTFFLIFERENATIKDEFFTYQCLSFAALLSGFVTMAIGVGFKRLRDIKMAVLDSLVPLGGGF